MPDASDPIERALPFVEPARLQFRGDLVNVSLAAITEGTAPRLMLDAGDLIDDIECSVEEREGTVEVTVRRRDPLRRIWQGGWRGRWSVNCLLTVPETLEARVETDAGRIELNGLTGTFDLRTDAGHVSVAGVRGMLRIESNAGKIDCTGFRGVIDAATDAGAIRLEAEALEAGTSTLRAEVGKIDVRLPREAAVRVEARSSIGRVRNAFGNGGAGAPALLRVQAEVGAINVQAIDVASGAMDLLPARRSEQARHEEIMRLLDQVASHELSAEEANRRIAALR